MKKLLAALLASALLAIATPTIAQSFDVKKYYVLSGFTGTGTKVSTAQLAKLKTQLKSYPKTNEVFCTGLVYTKANTTKDKAIALARAEATCAKLTGLKPTLISLSNTTQTKLSSEKNQVEVMFRWNTKPVEKAPYVKTDSIDWNIDPQYQEGKPCGSKYIWQVVGLDQYGKPAYLVCSAWYDGIFLVDRNMPKINAATMQPQISKTVAAKSYMGYGPNLYIEPTIVSTKPKTALSSGAFDNYEKCKIAEPANADGSSDKSYGFPLPKYRANLKKNFKILVIPVQFTDHETTYRPADDMADIVSGMTNFYTRMGNDNISFDWTIPEKYIQLGRSIESFDLGYEFDGSKAAWFDSYTAYIQFVVDFVDPDFDFSAYDAVVVEEPRTVTDAEHGMFIPNAATDPNGYGVTQSDEGAIMNLLVTGDDEVRNIPNWIHEFGHLLGLGDRNWSNKTYPAFDLMFGSYFYPELSVWNRWLLGILNDDQVDCKTDTTTTKHLINPVEWVGDFQKAVIIPISETVVLVAESRRRQGYDALLGKESEGVYVYRVDTSARMYAPDKKNIVDVVRPKRSKPIGTFAMDASLKNGESVSSDGWTIKVVESGSFGDVIQVSKK